MNSPENSTNTKKNKSRLPTLLLLIIPLVSLILLVMTIYIGNALSDRERESAGDASHHIPTLNMSGSKRVTDIVEL
ncbi:MAG: hypothetical protein AAF525_06345 [Pseudomonadota bacterium]